MSHYQPYPEYRNTGMKWLPKIPEHWEIVQSRRLFSQRKERANESDQQLTASQKYGIVYQTEFMELEGARVMQVIKGADILKRVCPNDFVISMRSFQGGLEWSSLEGSISSAYVMLVPQKHVVADFFRYLFKSAPYIQALQSTSDLIRDGQALRFDNFAQVDLPIIPEDEQVRIAKYLDRETARINALVEKKTRFIELLREKRQALITHAITKGLDPNVKMKDSGVEWLGEVPEHWVVSRLRHNIDGPLSYGANEAAESDEPNDPRFIRITDLHEDGTLREDTFKSLPWNVAQPYLLSDGDVLLARSGATVGKSFIYRESMGPSCYAGYLIRARLLPSKLISQYFWLCTQSTYYWDFIAGSNIQATIQNVSGEKYANLWLAVPPIKEQQRIINFLEEACDRLDAVRVKTERSIELLKERRSALITAAVTGQIDLREAV